MKAFDDTDALNLGRAVLETFEKYLDGAIHTEYVEIPLRMPARYSSETGFQDWVSSVRMQIPRFVVRKYNERTNSFDMEFVSVTEFIEARRAASEA